MFDQRAIISENEHHGGFVFFEKKRARPGQTTLADNTPLPPKKGGDCQVLPAMEQIEPPTNKLYCIKMILCEWWQIIQLLPTGFKYHVRSFKCVSTMCARLNSKFMVSSSPPTRGCCNRLRQTTGCQVTSVPPVAMLTSRSMHRGLE